jgi:hypothetical protein
VFHIVFLIGSPKWNDCLIIEQGNDETEASEQNEDATSSAGVLVVEDIIPNQMIARKLLQNTELAVELADNGEISVDSGSKGKKNSERVKLKLIRTFRWPKHWKPVFT